MRYFSHQKRESFTREMWSFVILTVLLTFGLLIAHGLTVRKEIIENWSKYRTDPRYIFTAFMYKPDDDPRSRVQFASDNFNDVIMIVITDVFKVLLEPVFKIFGLFMGAAQQSLGGLLNMRGLLGTLWKDFMKISGGFMNRFAATFHELRITYTKIQTSIQRIWAIATATVFQGISFINAIMSFIDLMVTICIVILVALVVLVIFFWFALWPIIPLILIIIAICVQAGFGDAVGGMSSSFCFGENALVVMADGTTKPIREIKLNDKLWQGIDVTAVMEFRADHENTKKFYSVDGIPVSGSHIIFTDSGPKFVADISSETTNNIGRIFCMNTSTHRIPVRSINGKICWFSDWEEISEENDLLKWHKEVFETVNPGCDWKTPSSATLHSEALVHETTRVRVPFIGEKDICDIRPGDFVIDADSNITRVVGIVKMHADQVKCQEWIGGFMISGGAWVRPPFVESWSQITDAEMPVEKGLWYSLFTESGTYMLSNEYGVRDFTDVGAEKIENMYEWVLESLAQ